MRLKKTLNLSFGLVTILLCFASTRSVAVADILSDIQAYRCYEGLTPQIDLAITQQSTSTDPDLRHIDIHNAFKMGMLSSLSYSSADEIPAIGHELGFDTVQVFQAEKTDLSQSETTLVDAFRELWEHHDIDAMMSDFRDLQPKKISFADSQAVWLENDRYVVLAFRGTLLSSLANIFTDLDNSTQKTNLGTLHSGFYNALVVLWGNIDKMILEMKTAKPIYVTGHSLGGAMATLAAAQLLHDEVGHQKIEIGVHEKPWLQGFYTFGAPMVGDEQFVQNFETNVRNIGFQIAGFSMGRFEDPFDMIPLVPDSPGVYSQLAAPLVYFKPQGTIGVGVSAMADIPKVSDLLKKENDEILANHLIHRYLRQVGVSLGLDPEKLDACSNMMK